MTSCQIRLAAMHLFLAIFSLREWSKSLGGGWSGAFGNVVDKKYMAHPVPSAQK